MAANALTWVIRHVTTAPPLRAALERWLAWGQVPLLSGDLPEQEAELLALVLYWTSEYYQHRLSPAELLIVLRNLLNNPHEGG